MVRYVPAFLASFFALLGSAHAELPTGVSTAITSGGADGGTLMGLLAAAGAALYIVWKILKKAGIML